MYCWPIYLRIFGIVTSSIMDDPAYYYTTEFYGIEILASISNFLPTFYSSNMVYVVVWVNIRTDMRRPNKYMQSYHRNRQYTWCTLMLTTCTIWRCVNHCYTLIWIDDVDNFDVTTIVTDSLTRYVLEVEYSYLHDAISPWFQSNVLSNARETIRQARGEVPRNIVW